MKQILVTTAMLIALLMGTAGQQKGKVIIESINAPSLSNSMIGEPTSQPIAIYLPPSYEKETDKKYPVIYFLPGYEDTLNAYIKGYINGYYFEQSMNSNITQGRLKEVIMVIINGFNLFEGSFYHNSPVTGNWEDFVVKDVVNYIDAHYRTIPSAESRAITGLSMGGYGALHLSMKYPSVFSVAVGQCPGLATPFGIMKSTLFIDENVIRRIISIRAEIAKYAKEEAHQKYLDTIQYYRKNHDWVTLFTFAYGSAFAPNVDTIAPYFDYPFSIGLNNKLVMDTAIFKTWEQGFGNLKEKLALYKDSLLKLKGYAIDYGTNDYFQWIPTGCKYYDTLLTNRGIPHRLWVNNGGHGDLLKSRTENVELPYCDSLLNFDDAHLNTGSQIESFTCSNLVSAAIIDNENHKINIVFKAGAKVTAVKPTIFISPGSKISPSIGTAVDFTSGSVTYTVTSEDGSASTTWTINSEIASGIDKTSQLNEPVIHPNPAKDYFILSSGKGINKVEIFDLLGTIKLSKRLNTQIAKINNLNLKTGSYFVKTYSTDECFVTKVIIK